MGYYNVFPLIFSALLNVALEYAWIKNAVLEQDAELATVGTQGSIRRSGGWHLRGSRLILKLIPIPKDTGLLQRQVGALTKPDLPMGSEYTSEPLLPRLHGSVGLCCLHIELRG